MGIIGNNMAPSAAAQQPAKAEQAPATPAPKAPGPGNPKAVIVAIQGALFDERVGLAEKIIESARSAKNAAGALASASRDIVLSVCEKMGLQPTPAAMKPLAMMVFGQLLELADAAGIEMPEEQQAAAAQAFVQQFGSK